MGKGKNRRAVTFMSKSMREQSGLSGKDIFFTLLPWACLIGAYLAAVLFQLHYGKQLLNSDMSSEMLLANELNQNGEFVISKSWYYSSELRVLNQQLTLQLGLCLFPHNWHLARTFSMAVLLAFHALCYLFLSHECGLGKIGVYSAAILMCPFGFWYMWYGTWGTFYLPYMILISLDLALLLHATGEGRRHRGVCLVLLLALSFLEGLSGVRMLMNFFLPLCVAVAVIVFLGLQNKNVARPRDLVFELRLGAAAAAATGMSGLGYLVNSRILSQSYSFITYSEQYWQELDLRRLISVLGYFINLFGYPYQENYTETEWEEIYLFSKEGILGAFGLVLLLAVVFSFFRLLKRWKELNAQQRLVLCLLCACLLVDGIVYTCLTESYYLNSSYWLPIVPLGIALLAIEIRTETFHFPFLRSAVTACLLISVALCSFSTVSRFLTYSPRTREGLEEVGEWLVANGWTQGYASFWNGNVLTELTDGEVAVWVVSSVDQLGEFQWLQSMDHDTAPEGEVFVLLKSDDNLPYFFEENLIYADENGWVVMGYDSAEQLFELMEAGNANLGVAE